MNQSEHAERAPAAPEPAVAGPATAHGLDCGCVSCSPAWSAGHVLALQRGAGNAAVARTLARQRTLGRVIDDGPFNAAREAREQWIAAGVRGPIDHTPSTGRGGFSAAYDPAAQELAIKLCGGVDFRDGIRLVFGFAIAMQSGNAPAAAAAQAINARPRAERPALIAPWVWDDAAKATFLADFKSAIEGTWQGKHQFHNSTQFWEDLGAATTVEVDVHEGAQTAADHMKVISYKESTATVASTPAYVGQTQLVGAHGAHDNVMEVNSQQVGRRSDILQSVGVEFQAGTNTLTAQAITNLNWFANAYKSGGGPRCATCSQEIKDASVGPVNVTVPGEGADPAASALARFGVITAQLVTGGMADAATRCHLIPGPGTGTAGSVAMGAGVQQIVAAHEAGHMFGLGDEYTAPFSGTGGALGTPVDGDLGPAQNLPGAVHENSDSIMSVGDAVRPQHYATFLEALKAVTGTGAWVFGPPQPVSGPNPALDWQGEPGPGGTAPVGAGTAVA
ncbi:MAG TPA: hypothetical protein VNS09_14320 [Solirubrobacter sp.]|nr:hypothetical protein [Solirubrobacter sp.]